MVSAGAPVAAPWRGNTTTHSALLVLTLVAAALVAGCHSAPVKAPSEEFELNILDPTEKPDVLIGRGTQNQYLTEQVMQALGARQGRTGQHNTEQYGGIITVSSVRGEEAPAEFDYHSSLLLAELASIAQCQPRKIANWTCSRCSQVPGFLDVSVDHDVEQELLAFSGWSPTLKSIVVVFRGTDKHSLSNWLADLMGWQTDFDVPWCVLEDCRVHRGFFNAYNTSTLRTFASGSVLALLNKYGEVPVTITGHSLGGALASLCAVEMKTGNLLGGKVPVQVHLNTLGCPRVGNLNFTRFAAQVLDSSIRVTHSNDIVPSLPLQSMGFQHLSREVWLADITVDTEMFFSSPIQIAVVCDGTVNAAPASARPPPITYSGTFSCIWVKT
eukprot:CAMPEP_0117671388 /NCGR_PEP_ID=MMETSP0804-20121206/13305_1 /TAXON_ID=1074897 /ORGANISM="Tetraselmis astigmatica, Strain CCMP880" /LENGTH=384 /DNA_ID=CAMNT_0005479841 /DNA_START=170 /DNA_END=1324 /DNA_ORIENTATION=+